MPHPLLHWLLLLSLVVMWGSSFLLTKIAVTSLPPSVVAAGRIGVAAIILGALVVISRKRLPGSPEAWGFLVLMALVGFALPFSLISWGQQRIDSGLAGILMACMPLATLMLAHFFVAGERLTTHKVSGFVLGFFGIVVLIGPDALLMLGGGGEVLIGQLAVLGGALCYAVQSIIARRAPSGDVWVTSALVVGIATLLTVPVAARTAPWPDVPATALLAVLALGLVSTAMATVVFYRLVKLAGPTFLSLINYLIPLWAVALGMIFLGEKPQWNALAALVLILGGIGLSQRGNAVPGEETEARERP